MVFEKAIECIGDLDRDLMDEAKKRLDSLTKPLGSLGKLEAIVQQIVGISKDIYPDVHKKTVVIMCGDNGVVEEGVSSCPKSVTATVTRNFLKGFTGINVFTKFAGADIVVVDVGVDGDVKSRGVVDRKIRRGTWNIAKGPAMTREEAIKAIETGILIVKDLKSKGVKLLGTGEMGIGNTTTSSAVSVVLTNSKPEDMVGCGSGISNEGFKNKIEVVRKAVKLNKPDANDAVDVVSKVGGFDLAGLIGCFIGASAYRIPIVIDGFISATAALAAVRLEPKVKNFIIPSHASVEPGNKKVMEALKLEPMLDLNMRLGEGTGAALFFNIIDCAFCAYKNMGTFDDANIDQYREQI
ncbi:nicotinate-nucleotide--dimethylbenzimidazole phosphoribosyltransferase [Herbivorax sp. ANBcel31]|uniref:nicotinate-nucleotide--dimethylbenzimidazole phosphoribosyltransferase n=1 Tax=Herbivorax sp. ANBcel31 TaxID=3069754 RepID=UPI0027B4B667|nr:nicotinate-nucleotide--dimethylbenzimidazole phosphoribosyltransferase [Herbivorax sp. ANBcel31]MDQ2085010.1 nicotinate-nucleotide--dimethylbenzimidazole phosphoribosyltransferase [Herbivorax sp. ANBcel31]